METSVRKFSGDSGMKITTQGDQGIKGLRLASSKKQRTQKQQLKVTMKLWDGDVVSRFTRADEKSSNERRAENEEHELMCELPYARVRKGRPPVPAEGRLHLAYMVGVALPFEGWVHALRWHDVVGALDVVLAFGVLDGRLKPDLHIVIT